MAVLSQLVDDVVATSHELSGATTDIGRHPASDLRIDEISVSSRHAVIETEANIYLEGAVDYYISDCDSTNGTFINDIRLSTRQRLNSYDLVRIGWNLFRFIDDDENSLEKTAYILEE